VIDEVHREERGKWVIPAWTSNGAPVQGNLGQMAKRSRQLGRPLRQDLMIDMFGRLSEHRGEASDVVVESSLRSRGDGGVVIME
jgi:hypothetical protein